MRKWMLLSLLLITAVLCGCQQEFDPETCVHPETELVGNLKYVYGQYCDDPVELYLTCNLCGADVFRGKRPNVIKCGVASGKETVTKEPTCTEVGRAQGNCEKCGKLKEWDVPIIDHRYLWFYGDDAPSCAGCELTTQLCIHEYELTYEHPYTKSVPGWRHYQCKLCQHDYKTYFDEHGDYDLRAALDAVCTAAQNSGWIVIFNYNLQSDYINQSIKSINCNEIDSTSGTQLLTDAGLELLEQWNQHYPDPASKWTDYYLLIEIDFIRDARGTYKFFICMQLR